MGRLTLVVLLSSVFLTTCSDVARDRDTQDDFWAHRVSTTPNLSYGDDPAQKLDLYRQGSRVGEPVFFEPTAERRPTLLFIHGGGWIWGAKEHNEYAFLPFLERGWQVVSIGYRLGAGTAPAAVDDAVCALDWIVENADEFGFDLDRVVVSGESAGGHLALTTGIFGSRPGHPCTPGNGFRPAAVINWYGVTDIAAIEAYLASAMPDLNYARMWIGDEARIEDISDRYSPLALVDESMPPVLTLHGQDDSIVPHEQATAFHDRLDELGIVNELRSMPGSNHGGFTDDQFQEWWSAVFVFLESVGVHEQE